MYSTAQYCIPNYEQCFSCYSPNLGEVTIGLGGSQKIRLQQSFQISPLNSNLYINRNCVHFDCTQLYILYIVPGSLQYRKLTVCMCKSTIHCLTVWSTVQQSTPYSVYMCKNTRTVGDTVQCTNCTVYTVGKSIKRNIQRVKHIGANPLAQILISAIPISAIPISANERMRNDHMRNT